MKVLLTADAIQQPKVQAVQIFEAMKTGEVSFGKKGAQFDKRSSVTAGMSTEKPLDFEDLIRYASSSYEISDDPKDYAVVPVPIIISDVPNRNGVAFPAKSLASFSPSHGMPHFKTWTGKPTFEEHANNDVTKAKGIILDTVMQPLQQNPEFYKVVTLLAFDRTKDRGLYNRIVNGKDNAYSMGAYVDAYRCSYCGNGYFNGDKPKCSHISENKLNFYELNGKMVFKEVWGIQGFEVSSVGTPAYRMALSDYVNTLDPQLKKK